MEELTKQWLVIVFDKVFLGGAIALVALFVARRLESSKLLKQLLIETRAQRVSIKSQLLLDKLPVFTLNAQRLVNLVSDYNPRTMPSTDQRKEIYDIETQLFNATQFVGPSSSSSSKEGLSSLHQVAIKIDKELFLDRQRLNQQDEFLASVEWNRKSAQLVNDINQAKESTVNALQNLISKAVNEDFSVVSDLRRNS